MIKKPLISIIVPVYKVEKYLDICVESLVNQTYGNIEIILVDDGSPDNCPKLCDLWAERDSRVKVIHKENGGVFQARKTGVKASKGEYIAFVDSDDRITPDFAEVMLNAMTEYDCEVVSCSMQITSELDCEAEQVELTYEVVEKRDIMKKMPDGLCYLCAKLYKRELFNDFPEITQTISVSEDMLLNYFLYKNCKRVVLISKKMYFYFRHGESVLSGVITHKIIDDSMLAYRLIDEDYDKNDESYPDFIYNKVLNDYFLINSIIRNNKCLDRYDILRKDILKYRKYIFSSDTRGLYSKRHLIGTLLLMVMPKMYNASILLRTKHRGY